MKSYTIAIEEKNLNLLHDVFADAVRAKDSEAMQVYDEAKTQGDRDHAANLEKEAESMRKLHVGFMRQLNLQDPETTSEEFREFRIEWAQCPTNHNVQRVNFVKARSRDDARKIMRDHIERNYGIHWFNIEKIDVAPPVPPGEVLK